jgi:hypothetical protein
MVLQLIFFITSDFHIQIIVYMYVAKLFYSSLLPFILLKILLFLPYTIPNESL